MDLEWRDLWAGGTATQVRLPCRITLENANVGTDRGDDGGPWTAALTAVAVHVPAALPTLAGKLWTTSGARASWSQRS